MNTLAFIIDPISNPATTLGAILLAVAATVLLNAGFALQKQGVARAEGRALFRTPIWLAGIAVMSGGWGLYFTAAKFAPISVIQPTLGAGFVVLALFSVFYLQERLRVMEWVALAALVGGVILLGWSALGESAPAAPAGGPLVAVTAVCVAGAIAALLLARREFWPGGRRAIAYGLAAGLLIGLGSLQIKAMFNYIDPAAIPGRKLIAFGLCLPIVIAGNLLGIALMQRGFAHGKALVVVPLQQVTNKIVAILGGIFALGERLPPDPDLARARLLAFILILLGTAVLARFGGEARAEQDKDRDASKI
jgi:drug/metabolite transporter (DMT)-like permease